MLRLTCKFEKQANKLAVSVHSSKNEKIEKLSMNKVKDGNR